MRRLFAVTLVAALALAAGASAAGKRFARTDANGDGKISQSEFIAARGRIFDQIDADHNGQITRDEVAAYQSRMEAVAAGAMIRHGKGGGERGAGQLKRLAALTEQGPVTRAQWDAMMARRFQQMDRDGSGLITQDEMKTGRAAAMKSDAAPAAMTPPKD